MRKHNKLIMYIQRCVFIAKIKKWAKDCDLANRHKSCMHSDRVHIKKIKKIKRKIKNKNKIIINFKIGHGPKISQ